MKFIQIIIFSLLATQAKCQLTEVTYDVETNDTLSVKEYITDWATWEIKNDTITWIWYDKDSNLLLVEQYTIVSTETTEKGFTWAYLVNTQSGGQLIIELWIYADKSKAVSHRYADGVVYYTGNVSF